MGRLVIDGNKVYTVDEDCMRRQNLTLDTVKGRQQRDKKGRGGGGKDEGKKS